MRKDYEQSRRRLITFVLCLMLCAAGAYGCFAHLIVYLDVEIFDLWLLIEDLIAFAGYVLMAVGAFRVNRTLSLAGLAVVILQKAVGVFSKLLSVDDGEVAGEIYTFMLTDAIQILGLAFAVLMIFAQVKKAEALLSVSKKLWFLPGALFIVALLGYLFTNRGPLTDVAINMMFLGLAAESTVVWCLNPAGVTRWMAERIRENEEAENNSL